MRKRLSSLLALLLLCASLSFAAINKLLLEAQDLLKQAKASNSEQLYKQARDKFNNATHDINYDPDEHGPAIQRGLNECRQALSRLNRKLVVNGSANAVETNISAEGGNVSFTVSSTVGTPNIQGLPDWISVVTNNGTEITLNCLPNPSEVSRQAPLTFTAGGAKVSANVRQKGTPRKVKTGPGTGQARAHDLEFTDVTFMNATYDNRTITAAGQPLYAHEIRYLRPVITYNGPSADREVDLYTRIYDPDGKMLHTDELSPDGYTQGYNFTFFPGEAIEVKGIGWGHRKESLYKPGQYRFEFIIDGKLIYTAYATIVEREDDETYLAVNGQGSASLELKGAGGSATIFVSTSDPDWKIVDMPAWMRITKQTPESVTVSFGPNSAPGDRSAEFYIEGAGRQARINVVQPTNGPTATLENVRIVENAVVDGDKGIEIHANIVVRNARNHRLQIVAWFYYETGNPLMDFDGKYRSGDGQVTVNRDVAISDDTVDLGDFVLFIPYEQLDIKDPGQTALEFDMGIYDFQIGDFLAASPRVKFIYTR